MKKILFSVIILSVFISSGCTNFPGNKAPAPLNQDNVPSQMVGGDRDVHGCIGSAGYSWCEAKQKCLRIWEEKCEDIATQESREVGTVQEPENTAAVEIIPSEVTATQTLAIEPAKPLRMPAEDTSGWDSYQNKAFGMEIKFPKSWEGYKVTEGKDTDSSYVGFSFIGKGQPFTIFKISRYDNQKWESLANQAPYNSLRVLSGNDERTLVCDGCCFNDGDFLGGGQFNEFQIARCKDVPRILNTFQEL